MANIISIQKPIGNEELAKVVNTTIAAKAAN
jgi:hypothetical protein